MKQMAGAIFDFDGTLVDSMNIWVHMASNYLKSIGVTPSKNVDTQVFRLSLVDAARYLVDTYHLGIPEAQVHHALNQGVEDAYFNQLELKPSVPELLAYLHENGVKMCIATASDRYLVEAAVKRIGLDQFISKIFTCTEQNVTKSTPHIYQIAMEYLGTNRKNTMVFEDSFHAICSAKKDGFVVAGIYDETEKENIAQIKEVADYFLQSGEDWKKVSCFNDQYIPSYIQTN